MKLAVLCGVAVPTAASQQCFGLIVVELKDRFTRFCFTGYKTLLNNEGRDIEVVNEAANGKEELLQDLISIITSFCARLYGQRRCKRKTEKII